MTPYETASEVLRAVGRPLHFKKIFELAAQRNLLPDAPFEGADQFNQALAAAVDAHAQPELLASDRGIYSLRHWRSAAIPAVPAVEAKPAAPAAAPARALPPAPTSSAPDEAANLPVRARRRRSIQEEAADTTTTERRFHNLPTEDPRTPNASRGASGGPSRDRWRASREATPGPILTTAALYAEIAGLGGDADLDIDDAPPPPAPKPARALPPAEPKPVVEAAKPAAEPKPVVEAAKPAPEPKPVVEAAKPVEARPAKAAPLSRAPATAAAPAAEAPSALESEDVLDERGGRRRRRRRRDDEGPETDVEVTPPAKAQAKPVVEAPKPVVEAPKPVVEAPKPVVEAPKPVAEAPKPVVEAPKPVVEAPKPVVEAPKPVVEAPKPVAEAPKPVVEATKPVVEAPRSAPKPAAPAKEAPRDNGGRGSRSPSKPAPAAGAPRFAAIPELAAQALSSAGSALSAQALSDSLEAPTASVHAALSADNLARAAAGQRPRFALQGDAWADADAAISTQTRDIERKIQSLAADHRALTLGAFTRALRELPREALRPLLLALLTRQGFELLGTSEAAPGLWVVAARDRRAFSAGGVAFALCEGAAVTAAHITALRGTLHHYEASRALIITAGDIAPDAVAESQAPNLASVQPVDGQGFANLLIEAGLGVTASTTPLLSLDRAFFTAIKG
jgi:hypothetical protein